ncbi:unnamed protein product [Trifolium pratense]|uniref:Uncharacterized protein n=1 Tax=Trifolium pratense TaxID=57577 RepID=A0ACB0KH73_TRIPR|nr:unnamed protein product [Trifolium pratense]
MKMEASLAAVEQIIGYTFRNKKLLEEALTHTSDPKAVSYECLEFAGDAVLGLAINSLVRAAYVSTEKLGRAAVRHGLHHNTLSIVDKIREFVDAVQRDINSLVRAAYVSTEKLGRAAVRHGLHHNTLWIVDKIREFVDAVQRDDDCSVVLYGGSVKAPKILADIVESIAAAVYVDVDFDLKKIMGGMYGYSLANFYEQTLRIVPDFVGCSVKLNMLVIKLIVSC